MTFVEGPLKGASALVIGASRGIGAATARRLAGEGAAVALVSRRTDRLEALAAEIAASGGKVLVVPADVTDPGHAEEAVSRTVEGFSRLDILINNAGISLLGTALHANLQDWDRMIARNIEAVLRITHAAVPHLIDGAATSARGVADIVNVSSTSGRVALPAGSVYTLTQFGLNGFTEALRQELLVERVRVGVVQPETVNRRQPVDHLRDEPADAASRRADDADSLQPEDVADAIAYMVTRERHVAINEIVVRAAPSWPR